MRKISQRKNSQRQTYDGCQSYVRPTSTKFPLGYSAFCIKKRQMDEMDGKWMKWTKVV